MFNFFKKINQSAVVAEIKEAVKESFAETPSYTIKDVHNAFDAAEKEILDSVDAMLQDLNIQTISGMTEKAEMLEKLGFKNSKTLIESNQTISKIKMSEALAKTIREYQQSYPFQKFITEDVLNQLCMKYNLIYAPVECYIEDVPMKNLKEIANAPGLNYQHVVNDETLYQYKYNGKLPKELADFIAKPLRKPERKEPEFDLTTFTGRMEYREWEASQYKYRNMRWDFHDLVNIFGYKGPEPEYTYVNWACEWISVKKTGLFIAAPQQHFDLSKVEKHGEFGYATVNRTLHKDPIVFRYVKGGIQILSKWGDEANDVELQNGIDN